MKQRNMRFIRIFLLYFENLLEYRSRAFVWFLISVLSTAVFLLFWTARYKSNNVLPAGWTIQDITNYYLLFIFAGATLMSHIESDVADFDIYRGELNKYILKPYHYYLAKLYEELPYRIIQGLYAFIVLTGISVLLPHGYKLTIDLPSLMLGLISCIFAFILSQTYKIALGMIAFWFTDAWYASEFSEILTIVFSGITIPLVFLKGLLYQIAIILPFGSMLYTPVVILIGKISFHEALYSIGIQILWIIFFIILYKILFKFGIRRFTGVND